MVLTHDPFDDPFFHRATQALLELLRELVTKLSLNTLRELITKALVQVGLTLVTQVLQTVRTD